MILSSIIGKIGAPVLIGVALGVGGILGLQHLSPEPKVEVGCPPPVCNCDCPDPINAIDIEKLKNFKGNFTLNQNYSFKSNQDSLYLKSLIAEMHKELERLRVVKCR